MTPWAPMMRWLPPPRSVALKSGWASWSACSAARRWRSRILKEALDLARAKIDLAVALASSGRYPERRSARHSGWDARMSLSVVSAQRTSGRAQERTGDVEMAEPDPPLRRAGNQWVRRIAALLKRERQSDGL